MKSLLNRLRRPRRAPPEAPESVAATTLMFDERALVPWPQRAAELRAQPLDAGETARALLACWHDDAAIAALPADAADRLAAVLTGAELAAQAEVLRQDEPGDHLLVLLEGHAVLERRQGAAALVRLAELRAGDLIGEMAVFDAGPRFATCRTLRPCRVAVLEAAALQRLMRDDAALAAALLAAIARRLSLRLRQSGARLSALLAA